MLDLIACGECTPFLGAGAAGGVAKTAAEIAGEWADTYDYPMTDRRDLARVAQWVALQRSPIYPKRALAKEIQEWEYPDFAAADEPHMTLAGLDLPIYITTNYDPYMTRALEAAGKDPHPEFCRWSDFLAGKDSLLPAGYEPSPDRPLVYHLHGIAENPQSMVLTEKDYLDFLVGLAETGTKLLPTTIRDALASTAILFVGYSMNDWNFRILMKAIAGSLGGDNGYPGIAVNLVPPLGDDSPEHRQSAQAYLEQYFSDMQKKKFSVYWGEASQFAGELRRRREAQTGLRPAGAGRDD